MNSKPVFFLIIGIGIGAAMSVALHNTAVGLSIGAAVALAFITINNRSVKR